MYREKYQFLLTVLTFVTYDSGSYCWYLKYVIPRARSGISPSTVIGEGAKLANAPAASIVTFKIHLRLF